MGAFQEGIKHRKIAASWLIINLSAAIPTVASIVIYREAVNLKKLGILGLIVVAIVLVWLDSTGNGPAGQAELQGQRLELERGRGIAEFLVRKGFQPKFQ